MNILRSEWRKLTTTKAFYWNTALFILLPALFSIIVGKTVQPDPLLLDLKILKAATVAQSVSGIGFIILIIQAIMVISSEYRHNYASVTFMATPRREVVALVKWLMYSVIAAVLTFITLIICFYVAKLAAGPEISKTLIPFEDDIALRTMWAYPLSAVGLVTIAQGLTWMVRQTAGAISLMLMWMLALESLLTLIPKVGVWVVKLGPMSNLFAFFNNQANPLVPAGEELWDVNGSGLYFGVWAIVFFLLGVIILRKRDA